LTKDIDTRSIEDWGRDASSTEEWSMVEWSGCLSGKWGSVCVGNLCREVGRCVGDQRCMSNSGNWGRGCQHLGRCCVQVTRSSDQSSGMDCGSDQQCLVDHWSGRNFTLVVQGSSSVLGLDTRFVGGDGSSEASSIGDVVHGPESAVSISQSIGSSDTAVW